MLAALMSIFNLFSSTPIMIMLGVGMSAFIAYFFTRTKNNISGTPLAQSMLDTVAQMEVNKGQLEVNAAEASTGSIFLAGWRPLVGWACSFAFILTFLIEPLTLYICAVFHITPPPIPKLDSTQMIEVLMGMLGMGGLRSWEKVNDAQGNH